MKVDLLTMNLVLLVQLVVQAAGWFVLQRGVRDMPGVRNIVLGSAAAALGAILHAVREFSPSFLIICAANLMVVTAYATVLVGMMQLVGRPTLRWLARLMVGTTIILWPAMLLLAPENTTIRIVALTAFIGLLATASGINLIWASNVRPSLRWTLVAVNLAHGGTSLLRAFHAQFLRPSDASWQLEPEQILWVLSTILYAGLHFIALVGLVGSRLLNELTRRNEALANEVEARRQLQVQLSAALDKEGELRREQRLFIDMVGHDFRTPVAVIDRAAEMLENLLPQAGQAVLQRLETIRGAGRRLRRLMDTFLANEQLEGGLSAGRREPVLLKPLLEELCRDVGASNAGRLSLTVAPADEALAALGDPDWIATICGNLIDNALKYSSPDQPVKLSLARRDGQVLVGIADHGIGIPADDLAQLGERFFRGANAAKARGTGLGLHAVRRLLEAQNGELRLRSDPGKGTYAEISLPAA
ncbi:sensor histidine kinase [Ferrovibrio sp.]|uniref:sensor histidine kinase n=1 Tax=Ferrovibrio sp. TaxID=1917215 RepID=UPI003D14BA54